MNPSTAKPAPTRRATSLAGLALFVASAMLIAPARAEDIVPVKSGLSGEPDRWVVSCRHLSSAEVSHMSGDQMKYWRATAGQWQADSADSFAADATSAGVITIYVHGNQISSSGAFRSATRFARILGHGDPPAGGCLATFSWPSARVNGNQIHDARVKATRSERYAPALAHFIAAQPDDVAINLVGHSFGARLIAVALDDLADNHPPRSGPIRAVLLAGALSNSWLLPGHRCGAAITSVESLTVTTSSTDRVLRWYPLLWGVRNRGPEALGETGLVCRSRLGNDLAKYRQINVSCAIGKSHDWQDYLATPRVRQAIRELMVPAMSHSNAASVAHTLPTPPPLP